jgi:hypothetical protein
MKEFILKILIVIFSILGLYFTIKGNWGVIFNMLE